VNAVTRHITYHVTMPDEALVTENVTKEELDLAVLKMADDWEPADGESRVEMHFKGLNIHVVAEAKIVEKPVGVAYVDPSVVMQNWDDITSEILEGHEDFIPPVVVVAPQPPLSRLFRALEYIPEKRMRHTLLCTITDAQDDHHEALLKGDVRRARLVIWYALYDVVRTLVWGLRWIVPLLKWFFTRH
jgi:hypothetical protein